MIHALTTREAATAASAQVTPHRPQVATQYQSARDGEIDATYAAIGTGLALGTLFGVILSKNGRIALSTGVVGGVVGLAMKELASEDKPGSTGVALAVRQGWNLTQAAFARLVGYSTRAVAGYETRPTLDPGTMRRYTEVDRMRLALAKIMQADYIPTWLNAPNPAFDGSTPMQVIERGESDRVWSSIYHMDSGIS